MQKHIQNLGTDPRLLPCEPCTDAMIISDMEMNDHSFVPTNGLTCLIDHASCFTQGVGRLELIQQILRQSVGGLELIQQILRQSVGGLELIQQILSWQKKRVANFLKVHI